MGYLQRLIVPLDSFAGPDEHTHGEARRRGARCWREFGRRLPRKERSVGRGRASAMGSGRPPGHQLSWMRAVTFSGSSPSSRFRPPSAFPLRIGCLIVVSCVLWQRHRLPRLRCRSQVCAAGLQLFFARSVPLPATLGSGALYQAAQSSLDPAGGGHYRFPWGCDLGVRGRMADWQGEG